MAKNPPRTRKITYREKKYICTPRNGKVTVRVERTAHGQNFIAGTFDTMKKIWENETLKTHLPDHVKAQVETIFS